MNERKFVERRKPDWDRFEAIIKKANSDLSKLTNEELFDIGSLYRRITSDLAFVRTHGVSTTLTGYLNDLAGRGYGLLYTRPRAGFKRGLRNFLYHIPIVVRRRSKFIYMAVGLTVLGTLIGVIISAYGSSELKNYFLPAEFRPSLEHWKSGVSRGETAVQSIDFTGQLWINNAMVAIKAFASGLTLGIFTVILLVFNGLMLGIFGGEVAKTGHLASFYAGIAPHSVTEISAIFLAAAGGLIMAKAILQPGDRGRLDALKEESSDALVLLCCAILMLVFAAGIEAWFSHKPMPYPIKFGFAFATLIGWLTYWIGLKEQDIAKN